MVPSTTSSRVKKQCQLNSHDDNQEGDPSNSSSSEYFIPQPPRFNDFIVRKLPKSTEEKETEMMEHFRSRPFKANPIRFQLYPTTFDEVIPSTRSSRRSRVTKETNLPLPVHRQHESDALKENNRNQQHHHNIPSTTQSNTERIYKPTVPLPFQLRADERIKKRRMLDSSEADSETKGEDRRPLIRKDVGPFQLSSVVRHELHKKQIEEKLLLEEQEIKKQSEFRAREYNPHLFEYNDKKNYLRRNNKHVYNPAGDAKDLSSSLHIIAERYKANNIGPFDLSSVRRHEAYLRQLHGNFEDDSEDSDSNESVASYFTAIFSLSSNKRTRTSTNIMKSKSTNASKCKPDASDDFTLGGIQLPLEFGKAGIITKEEHNRMEPPAVTSFSSKESRSATIERSELVAITPTVSSWNTLALFCALCIFRILNVLLVRSYFDPDEFWQTLEPAYCEVFYTGEMECPGFTWEWKRRAPDVAQNLVERSMLGPARTYLSIIPVYWYYRMLRYLALDSHWLVSRGPMVLSAITIAAPTDLAVWYASKWMNIGNGLNDPSWSLFSSLTSWFNAYTLVRTFANGQENLLLISAVALVAPELLGDIDSRHFILRACLSFFLGGISVVIRFTSIAAFVPMGIILSLRNKSMCSKVVFLVTVCATFGLLGIGSGMITDRIFFTFWTIPFLGNFHFNVILNFAEMYGSHPVHWYFSAGLPAITGLLFPLAVLDLLQQFKTKWCHYGRRNLWIIILSYLIIMSGNSHKEFRYILPVLPLICVLCASHVRYLLNGSSIAKVMFVIANLVAVLYLGLYHQSGPILVNEKIVSMSREMYSINATESKFTIHYLTGGCHSTPLLSSLHAPPLEFDVWHLDCSPSCRADPDALCEYEQFASNPGQFIEDTYFPCSKAPRNRKKECLNKLQIAGGKQRLLPHYVVTLSSYVEQIRPELLKIGFDVVAHFPQNINGLRFGNHFISSDRFHSSMFRHDTFFSNLLEVSLEEMILFAPKQFVTQIETNAQQCLVPEK